MRLIPAGLGIEGTHQTHCLLVRVERRDGTVLGFTDHDRDLTYNGETYESAASFEPSAIEASEGTRVGTLQFLGVLDSQRIREVDLLAGLYGDARVDVFLVNWKQQPLTDAVLLWPSYIGEIQFGSNRWTAQLNDMVQRLQTVIGDLTSPTCRVRALFDAQCSPPGNTTPTSNPAAFRHTLAVTEIRSARVLVFGGDANPSDYYRYGRVAWLTGANAGLQMEVKEHTQEPGGAVVTLQLPFPFQVALGDTAMLEAGCDRRFAESCVAKFQNGINFRGEPHLPGTDAILTIKRR